MVTQNAAAIELEEVGLGDVAYLSEQERHVMSRLGYRVKLFQENGQWQDPLHLPDDNSDVTTIHMHEVVTQNNQINEVIRAVFPYLITRYLPKSIFTYAKVIQAFCIAYNADASIYAALNQVILQAPACNTPAAKLLVNFFFLHEVDGLSLDEAEELLNLEGYSGNRNGYLSLFTLDEELGPLTREEMKVLNHALDNTQIPIEDRTLLAICISFGLRPIQISLLKADDLVYYPELDLYYLSIPRVKQGAVKRRQQFTKRVLGERDAKLIKELIEANQELVDELGLQYPPLFFNKPKGFGAYTVSHEEHFNGDKKGNVHHCRGNVISHRFPAMASFLPNSPRTGKPFNLTAYRFRYTVGTNAVMEGMTEEEVAELLDHSSTLCVKHYFRYTREMWEMLENATDKRVEQQHFTAAWCREGDLQGNIYGEEVIETRAFTAIGKCHKKHACYLEPAVACYGCDVFCPNKHKQSHENAMENLLERKKDLSEHTSSAMAAQLDEALAGCAAAIAYADGIKVENINTTMQEEHHD